MNMKKVLALALALLMVVTASIAGTIAWLSATTENVTNTFTVGDINIDLKEHKLAVDGQNLEMGNEVIENKDYKIVPGDTQPKDPFVTIEAGSEDCWVFIQIKEVNNSEPHYIDWAIAEGWTEVIGDPDVPAGTRVFHRSYIGANEAVYPVLDGNTITYNDQLTKTQLDAIDGEGGDDAANAAEVALRPQLIFKAFAVQKEAGQFASDAWDQVKTEALS